MNRRQFLESVTGASLAWAASSSDPAHASSRRAPRTGDRMTSKPHRPALDKLQTFDYEGVRLLPGPFADRLAATRAFYLAIPNDDILKGFRRQAGLPAPGDDMGGWCEGSTALLFGQWLSGLARLYRATGDKSLREKAITLMTEWGKTLPHQKFGHYDYDKFVGGLVDMARYADASEALPLLAAMTDRAEAHLGRERLNATNDDSQGGYFNGQMEWYTLPENLYRAYELTGDDRYRAFAEVWLYPHYFGMFTGKTKATPDGFHGYSHVNALNSAAMAYAVTGDSDYLDTITAAYDYFQKTQCYATGGYGPGEKLMPPDGSLGRSVIEEPNAKFLSGITGRSFETPCGAWAVFKLGRYLQRFTGQARYGDWTERLLYNGIGAALPMRGRGETFYYADYRMTDARKTYFGAPWPCCAGTYIQDVADLHNLLYYQNATGLFINMYVPSEAKWRQGGQTVTLTQTTEYPHAETIHMTVEMAHAATFTLRLRTPAWAEGAFARVNNGPVRKTGRPGEWLALRRRWEPNDQVVLHLPLPVRRAPIDEFHPRRVARVKGPVALVQPKTAVAASEDAEKTNGWVPFAEVGEGVRYTMYEDLPDPVG